MDRDWTEPDDTGCGAVPELDATCACPFTIEWEEEDSVHELD